MRRNKFNFNKTLMAMAIWFLSSAGLVLAAGMNPPQSTTSLRVTDVNSTDDGYEASPESNSILSPLFLAPARYLVIEVMPANGHSDSKGYGINNLSQVVGRTYNFNEGTQEIEDQQALFWDLHTGSTALNTLDGPSGAWGINDTGMATGFSTDASGYERAVRWNLDDGTILDIGALTNPNTLENGNESYAYRGINNAHTVVGHAEIPNDAGDFIPFHGFIYDDVNGIRDMGTLTSSSDFMGGFSIAYDINEANWVVGIAHTAVWDFRAFIWTEETGMTELSVDDGRASGEWYAAVINESGMIAGHVIDGNGHYPYYWPTKGDEPIAVVMPEPYPYGEIYGLNENGQMVGGMFDDADHAFIFDSINGLLDLNTCIDPTGGWELLTALDINDMGQITGIGFIDGHRRAFVLTPNADADTDGDVDGSDMALLVQELGRAACNDSCTSDFNDDDEVNTIDAALLAMVLGHQN